MKKSYLRRVSVFVLTAFLCACQTVPFTGRKRVMLFSEEEENNMGKQAWEEISSKEKISTNSKYNAALTRIGTAISKAANKPDYKWEFKVIESDQANAFCLPGGKVAVYTGLFKYTENDAELAAVVGHEVAHALARHGGERMTMEGITSTTLAVVASTAELTDGTMMALGIASQAGVTLPYSRKHEYEADEIGILLMADAGYDPKAAVQFWHKFQSASPETPIIGDFLSTHPLGSKRIDKLNSLYPQAKQRYDNSANKKGLGEEL